MPPPSPLPPPPPPPTFYASDDCYVIKKYPDNNYDQNKLVWQGGGGWERIIFMRFEVTGLQGDMQSAFLKLWLQSAEEQWSDPVEQLKLYAVANTDWTEADLTYSDYSSGSVTFSESDLLAEVTSIPLNEDGSPTPLEIDVTAALPTGLPSGTYAFAIFSDSKNYQGKIESAETDYPPALTVAMAPYDCTAHGYYTCYDVPSEECACIPGGSPTCPERRRARSLLFGILPTATPEPETTPVTSSFTDAEMRATLQPMFQYDFTGECGVVSLVRDEVPQLAEAFEALLTFSTYSAEEKFALLNSMDPPLQLPPPGEAVSLVLGIKRCGCDAVTVPVGELAEPFPIEDMPSLETLLRDGISLNGAPTTLSEVRTNLLAFAELQADEQAAVLASIPTLPELPCGGANVADSRRLSESGSSDPYLYVGVEVVVGSCCCAHAAVAAMG